MKITILNSKKIKKMKKIINKNLKLCKKDHQYALNRPANQVNKILNFIFSKF